MSLLAMSRSKLKRPLSPLSFEDDLLSNKRQRIDPGEYVPEPEEYDSDEEHDSNDQGEVLAIRGFGDKEDYEYLTNDALHAAIEDAFGDDEIVNFEFYLRVRPRVLCPNKLL